jgi:hypothetical protein
MRLRIARKICSRLGYGYPIDNIDRIEKAVRTWKKACKRFKHFKRCVKIDRRKIEDGL